jgi:nickel-dependent lactate racemase
MAGLASQRHQTLAHRIAYGARTLSIAIPRSRLAGVVSPRPVRELRDPGAAIRKALERPHQSLPLADMLRGRKSALILTVDHTRPGPRRLLVPVLNLCRRAGAAPTIMIALGRHRKMTDAELRRHLGADICRRVRILQHDPFDDGAMVRRGTTGRGTPILVNRAVFEHDLVIGTGIIEPSYLAGFSGGRKLLMPGVAHHTAIDNNHYYLTDPGARIGRLDGNPVSEDAAEFAGSLPLHFILYSVVGPDDETVEVVAGHPIHAHRKGCDLSRGIYEVERREADIVISSAGGAPYDCDLVQGKKAVVPAAEMVKPNGVIILAAACPDGLGAEATFVRWLKTKTPRQVARDVLDRSRFSLGAHGANILARPIVQRNATVILVTCPAVAKALKGTYLTVTTDMREAWSSANRIAGPASSVLLIEKARRLIVRE